MLAQRHPSGSQGERGDSTVQGGEIGEQLGHAREYGLAGFRFQKDRLSATLW